MTLIAAGSCAVLLSAGFAAAWPLLGRYDARLEKGEPMLTDPRPGWKRSLRGYLGLAFVIDHLQRQERTMATITEALTALAEQVNAVSAAQATSFHNLQAAIDKLKAGELTPEQQDAVDQIEKSLTQLADDAQKADDSVEDTQPVEPTEPTDNPAPDAGDVPDEKAADTEA